MPCFRSLLHQLLEQEFCEECQDQSRVIRRDAAFKENSLLPAEVTRRTGEFIYDGLRNGFRVWSFN